MADPAFRHWFELVVRYADTDAQGHVYFANYLTYFDEAFTSYLHAIGMSPRRLGELGVDVVYRHAESEYLGRSYFEDRLRIGVRMDRIGRTSVTLAYAIDRERATIARGKLTNVCVDRETLDKAEVPAALREAVSRFEGRDF